jgi:acyl dehydratase
MAERIELTDELKGAIGRDSSPWTYEVTRTSVRAFARGVGYVAPVFYDVEAARAVGYRDLPAPPTYLGTAVFIPGKSDDTFSGPREGQPRLNHGLHNVLDGGTEVEYHEDICAGDTLTAVSRVSDLRVSDSKAIGKMLIVSIETRYTNQFGTLAAMLRSQVIFY